MIKQLSDTQSARALARDEGRGRGKMLHGHRVSVSGDERVLDTDNGDGCSAGLRTYGPDE